MVDLIPYFAGLIMILFGIAFYSAMATFRKLANESESESKRAESLAALKTGLK